MIKPYYESEGITIYHGDCREILPNLSADVVITDPPYNVGKSYGESTDDKMDPDAYLAYLAEIWSASAATGASTLLFTPGVVNIWKVPKTVQAPWKLQRLLGWHRKEFAGDTFTWGPAVSWEPIIWAIQTESPFVNRVYGHAGRDFLVVPSVKECPYRQVHPNPKPLPVMQWLVTLFAPEGGIVLDPFLGSGTTLRAAKDLGRRAIGIEVEERYCEIAVKRLAQEILFHG